MGKGACRTHDQHGACRLWRNLSFPKALYPLVTPAVLVETFEQGQLIHSFVDNPANPHNAELANIGRDCFLKMLLNDNFIHAGTAPRLDWLGWTACALPGFQLSCTWLAGSADVGLQS